MAVTIQDDMLRAADMMPRAQRAAFLVALVDYGESGAEPQGRPQWLPAFEVCKDRVAMSHDGHEQAKRDKDARREAARKAANARWSHDAGAHAGGDADAMRAHDADAMPAHDAPSMPIRGEEIRGDKGRKKGGGTFVPPTPEEVREYAGAKGLSVDAEDFCDYYGAQGWRLANGNRMRDWRLAANRWGRSHAKDPAKAEDFAAYGRGNGVDFFGEGVA